MDIEYSPHSPAADFWRQTYLKAMEVGHKDPAAVADAAFVDFESRFGAQVEEAPAEEQECLCGGGVSLQSVSGGAHRTGLYGTVWLNVEGETVEYARVKTCEQVRGTAIGGISEANLPGAGLPTYVWADELAEEVRGTATGDVGKVDTSVSALAVSAAMGMLAQAGVMASDAERMRDIATGVLAGAQNSTLPAVTIGEGPSIEAGDAPQMLEHGWQAGHVAPAEDTGDLG